MSSLRKESAKAGFEIFRNYKVHKGPIQTSGFGHYKIQYTDNTVTIICGEFNGDIC